MTLSTRGASGSISERIPWWLRFVSALLVLSIGLAVGLLRRDEIATVLANARLWPLVLSVVLLLIGNLTSVEVGRRALRSRGLHRSWMGLSIVILIGNVAKYVPGFVLQVVTHIRLARTLELDPRIAGALWLDITLVSLAAASALGGLGAWIEGMGIPSLVAAVITAAGVAGLVPSVRAFALRLFKLGERHQPFIRSEAWIVVGMGIVGMILYGLHGMAIVESVGAGPLPVTASLAAFAGGWAVGLVAIVFPGGLGPREAVVIGMLATRMPPDVALVAAGLSRFSVLVADLGGGAIGAALSLIEERQK